jgi:uncharacterized protein YbaR (Trm112 family)
MSTTTLPLSLDLLEILRDPYAIQQGDTFGPDPGKLTLVRDAWLVSADTGYKYPIRDGIPVMLVEEGARWKDTPIDALPVPPPGDAAPTPPTSTTAATSTATGSTNTVALAVAAVLVVLGVLIGIGWWRGRHDDSDHP